MRLVRVLLVTSLMVLAVPAVAAEDELLIDHVDTSGYPEVVVSVTPPAGMGSDVTFVVSEDGVDRPVDAELAGSEDLQVILLIDTSGSMSGQPIEAARDAALAFVEAMPEEVTVGVVGFGNSPELLAPVGLDRRPVISALGDLDATGETAMYDGVLVALDQFAGTEGRRTVVLLSDGGDTVSASSLEEVTAVVVASGAQLHVVELQSPESDSAALEQLGNAGRGSVVPVTEPQALAGVYGQIASQLVHRYRLVYKSGAQGSTVVAVTAEVGDSVASATTQVGFPVPPVTTTLAPVAEPEPLPALRAGEIVEVVGLGSPWALYAGAVLVYVALALGLLVALAPSEKRHQFLSGLRERTKETTRGRLLSDLADRTTGLVERSMAQRGGGSGLNTLLEQAGVLLRPAEFMVFVVSVSIAASLIGSVWGGLWLGLVLALLVLIAARVTLSFLRSRRQRAFADQLDDSLQLLAGSLRAGYGILQAIDSLSREADRPTADELRRVVLEARLGRNFHESLKAMAERLDSLDFNWVVDAIQIHQEVGGDLSEVLDNVGETIRDRNQVRRQIKALSAEGRLSAVILLILPFAVGILISFIVPGYIQELFNHPAGIAMLILGAVLMIIGAFWIKKIVKVVF